MMGVQSHDVISRQTDASQNESTSLTAFYVPCLVTVLCCMVLRVLSRRMIREPLKADDWTLLVGASLIIGSLVVLLLYSIRAGLGAHWSTLTTDQRKLFGKLNYAYNILNLLGTPTVKASILLLYRRVFITRQFHTVIWISLAFVASQGIAFTLVSCFACHPIRGFFDPTPETKCINLNILSWVQAILNIINDIIILAIPIPMVWRLQMTRQKKWALYTVFMFGGLTCLVAIIRIIYYLRFDDADPSYTFIGDAFATPAEGTLGVLCACMITWRPLTRFLYRIATHLSTKFTPTPDLSPGRSFTKSPGSNSNSRGRHKNKNIKHLSSPSSSQQNNGYHSSSSVKPKAVDKHLAQPENGPYYVLEELEMEDGQTAKWKTEPTTVSVEAGNRGTNNNKNSNNNLGSGGRRSMSVNQGSGRTKNRGKGKGSSSTDAVAGTAVDPHHRYHRHQDSDGEREGSDSQISLVEHDGITVEQEVVISESYIHVGKTE